LRSVVQDYCTGPENTLKNKSEDRAWEKPISGFSRGDDPLYEQYKTYVGPFHWTPWEIFSQTFPATQVTPQDLGVIVWVLPQTRSTKLDNRQQSTYPAERWARSRIFGEAFNNKLRHHVVAALQERGHTAVAPMLSPLWERKDSEAFVFASTWSERHAAYASGLGTFGLCDGLITAQGKAMRVGSVITDLPLPPTPRPYDHHQAYCLFFSQGTCGKCIARCPVGAISEKGHDKLKCSQHLFPGTSDFVKANYHFDGYGCGLCQTGVPCESRIPSRRNG
jgi:epoxyqueuosine reductase QueG